MLLNLFAQAAQGQQPNALVTLFPFILIMVVIWFFMIRPQAKKQKETQKMLSSLQPRDKVVTIGGLIGEIDSLKDESTVVIKVGKDVKLEVRKNAIASKIEPVQAMKK
ncbi:MAG: preprotein translocase subunit YajC [Candidatus Neomarinimicrobiota bacterium]|nr:preprotein translocase subunit YajC [Candidatus Neomarinimicrobiota bacterium]RKY48900.1 MAG: preprotein translocase subunit YajC [Candidatus Neomarinimicrobiota bacterium]